MSNRPGRRPVYPDNDCDIGTWYSYDEEGMGQIIFVISVVIDRAFRTTLATLSNDYRQQVVNLVIRWSVLPSL